VCSAVQCSTVQCSAVQCRWILTAAHCVHGEKNHPAKDMSDMLLIGGLADC
jgi:secreted trypsin-like serine protease